MTEDKMNSYALRGVEELLLEWGEKKRAVACLKKEDDEAHNTMIDNMIKGIELEMEALKGDLEELKGRV